jgi:hypothetical protein
VPFVSKAQQRFAFGTGQPWAKEWAAKTRSFERLPEHVRGAGGAGSKGAQTRQPKGQGGGGRWAGYVASPLTRDPRPAR